MNSGGGKHVSNGEAQGSACGFFGFFPVLFFDGGLISRKKTLDEVGISVAGAEFGIGEDFAVQWDRGEYAFDNEHFERARHARDGFIAIFAANDEFGNQRVVVWRDYAFGECGSIEANSGASWRIKGSDLPC